MARAERGVLTDPSIFKAYDVRGIYPDQMDEDVAYRIGRAFARVISELEGRPVRELRLGLGRDMPLSAPTMAARYAAGIQDEGADVLDAGNGMAGQMDGPVLDALPIAQVQTYWTPDGNFPDHEPNPLLPENRTFIVKKVLSEGAELGIAWDGDADRCFFIDDTGKFVDGDFLTALLAESILAKDPGALILYDVRASRAVRDTVERAGGRADVNRVGHAFFKTRMRKDGAAFGGEGSGHYYFRDFYCADSGTLPALLILELLSVKDKRMSELLAPYRDNYFISGEINSEVADQDAKMKEIAERYSDARIDWLDGVSVDYDDWHFNVRPSNTEPLLRLNLESLVSPDHMAEKRDEVLALIRS